MSLPEENLARRFAQRHELRPPVDILQVLGRYADVTHEVFPPYIAGLDATVLQANAFRQRPLVIINSARRLKARQRFTLAHELGHIVLPWHVGTIACHLDKKYKFNEGLYKSTETEANRFAAELLAPTAWVSKVYEESADLTIALERVQNEAGLSSQAAWIAVSKVLHHHIVVITDDNGDVVAHKRSRGIELAHTVDFASFDEYAAARGEWPMGLGLLQWWRFEELRSPLKLDSDPRDASKLLSDILDATVPLERRRTTQQSIAGILGSANGTACTDDPERLLAVLEQRFAGRDNLLTVLAHPDFHTYLQKQAVSLAARRATK